MNASSPNPPPTGKDRLLSVSELTYVIKEMLEAVFPSVWVSGEISNLSRPQSGHVYLTLKDDQAQIRAVMWRNTAQRVRFDLQDGLEVVCHGSIDVYAPRGSYQLVIDAIEPRGMGALQLALKQLHARLAAEGLFESQRKRPLPKFPRKIAFVTSPTGAAIRDFLEALRNRWPGADVLVIPARVQGDEAAREITAGIALANRLAVPPDVLVVGRGGGSLEDLWCFNEEAVVRAIFASRIPVVSAVGHEIDVTLSDLVADVRALTPTDAAHRVVPAADEVQSRLENFDRRMKGALAARAAHLRTRLEAVASARVFRRPLDLIRQLELRLDELAGRARRGMRHSLATARGDAAALAGRLESLSPLKVLARGYSITQRLDSGELVTDAEQVQPGERIRTRLARGEVTSRVEARGEEDGETGCAE